MINSLLDCSWISFCPKEDMNQSSTLSAGTASHGICQMISDQHVFSHPPRLSMWSVASHAHRWHRRDSAGQSRGTSRSTCGGKHESPSAVGRPHGSATGSVAWTETRWNEEATKHEKTSRGSTGFGWRMLKDVEGCWRQFFFVSPLITIKECTLWARSSFSVYVLKASESWKQKRWCKTWHRLWPCDPGEGPWLTAFAFNSLSIRFQFAFNSLSDLSGTPLLRKKRWQTSTSKGLNGLSFIIR